MADIFLRDDVVSLLKSKHVLFIGDSNVRSLYKDLVWLHRSNTLIDIGILRRRLELSYLGDKLLERSELTRGRDFSEHRLYEAGGAKIEFLFVTKCYTNKLETLFQNIKSRKRNVPDVIYMNSCLWDVCRWGPNGVQDYKINMVKLMKLLTSTLPATTLFIWGTALPTAKSTSGGLIIKQIEFIQAALRIHIIEANKFTASLVSSYGFDVLDFHHYMHYQITRRSADGIHFLPPAVRFLINLFLTHISLSWDVKLPGRVQECISPLFNEIKCAMNISSKNVDKMVQKIDSIASNLNCSTQSATSSNKKKKKNKKRKGKSNNRFNNRIITNENVNRNASRTPPLYQKAPNPVYERNTRQVTYNPADDTPRDFRLLSFSDFNPNISIEEFYENFEANDYNFAEDQQRESYCVGNNYNRFQRHQNEYTSSNYNNFNQKNDYSYQVNYANYLGNFVVQRNVVQRSDYNLYNNPEGFRTINVAPILNQYVNTLARAQSIFNEYNQRCQRENYNNDYNYRNSYGVGPIRSRPNTRNRYRTPYSRNRY